MLPRARLDELVALAADTIHELLTTARSEPVRASLALGILRMAERADQRDKAEQAAAKPEPVPADPPLTDDELTELVELFPHLNAGRVRSGGQAGMWRHHLHESRAWRDHWLENDEDEDEDDPQPEPPPPTPTPSPP